MDTIESNSLVCVHSVSGGGISKYSRYVRGRNYWRNVHQQRKKLISSVFTNSSCKHDPRPYMEVEVAGNKMKGLLDSGASVSCLGKGSMSFLDSLGINWVRRQSSVVTADGNPQQVLGYVTTTVSCNNIMKMFKLYIIPGLSQSLYLGIDFWKTFNLKISFESNNKIEEIVIDPNAHELDVHQSEALSKIRDSFPSFVTKGLGRTQLLQHRIDVGETKPIKQRHYPLSPAVQHLVDQEIDRMLSLGVIEESNSGWSSPIVLVKRANGKPRLCLDSRKLNAVTKPDAYPLPKIDGHLGRLANTKYISSIDLKDAFWQIELDADSREKTAFSIPGRPLYHFRTMPFGLCNAAQSMCRLMDMVIPHEYHDRIFVYIDDLLIVSPDFDSHLALLDLTAKRLRDAGLTINVEKSKFCLREIKYLGYIIGDGCIRTDPEKVSAVRSFARPVTVRQIRRFLGMAGWYRRFIRNFSTVSAPLTDLISKNNKFQWTDEAEQAFVRLKHALCSAPVLSHPDFSKPFVIQCDASSVGIGSVLYQLGDDGSEKPIAFLSQKLNSAQRNYSVTELECLAAVISIKKFRPYVEGQSFKVITDHASLKWLMNQKDLSGRLARWSLKLQGFHFTIEHRKGKYNIVPDTLSRESIDEISIGEDRTSTGIDLGSLEFRSEEYLKLKESIVAHQSQFPDLMVEKDLVFKRTKFGSDILAVEESPWKLWVPSGLRLGLIAGFHDPPNSSHSGISKTLFKLKQTYYWPRMAVDAHNYITNCTVCKETKAPNFILRPRMGKAFKTERPFQQIYIDLLGPYPRSKNGNAYIFIVLDHYSKFVLLKAIKRATSALIIDFLANEVFQLFGVPETVLSDNGSQFTAKDFEGLLKTFGTKHLFTAIYSPQANASERVNRSVVAAIRSYVKTDHSTWDAELSKIAAALRNTVHQSTGFSPNYLVFGQTIIEHASTYSLLRNLEAIPTDIEVIPPEDFSQLIGERVKRNLEKAHQAGEKTYNTRSRDVDYAVGQEIYYRNFTQSDFAKGYNAKLAKKFIKARIRAKIGQNRYTLEDLNGKIITGDYHAKDLRQ